MGCGDFAIVPASMVSEGNEALFLTSRGRKSVVSHLVSNSIALIYDNQAANTHTTEADTHCHEFEPLLVDALRRRENCACMVLIDLRLYLVVMLRGNLQLANRYDARCPEDVLYHVLNLYESYGLDVAHDPLYVHGCADVALLRKYVGNCVCV